ncbi:MAG: DUF937 domain-containing protein [Ruminococcaceae bacterium]|nr:DUF937 domain-containing protein [Oscillospiraceae bacterium]
MTDIKKLLNNDILKEISREADGNIDADDVAKVLNAVMPQLEESVRSGELAQRSADVQRGGVMDLLPLLLGGNSAGITSAVSQSTGVSNNSVNSILKIAAPILLYMLLKDDNAPQQQGGGLGLLGALLGGGQQPQQSAGAGLLGALLGGGQQQAQPQQNMGMNLLGSLLGGGQQQAQPQQNAAGGLLDLFGGQAQQPQQTQQTQQQSGGADLLGTLFSILGDSGK